MTMRGHFWYSEKQRAISERFGETQHTNRCKLDKTGEHVIYTEWTDTDKPDGSWDEYVYLGEGEYTSTT